MLLCPSRAPSDSGAAWGLFVEGKNPSSSDTLGFLKIALCITSGCDTVRSQAKQSQAQLSNCTGESPSRKKRRQGTGINSAGD